MFGIPNSENFIKTEPIDYGLSRAQKFYVETADNRKLLLRLSDAADYSRKKADYERMRKMDAAGIPMTRPIDFGLCGEGKNIYQLQTWCDGEMLEKMLPLLPKAEQYSLSVKAGEILRKIHSIPVDKTDTDGMNWYERYSDFIDESIKCFKELNMPIEGSDLILDYFSANRRLLKERPQCYLHNDYHAANIILSPAKELCVIDWEILLFNNYGDPWLDISMYASPDVSVGLIHGYFEGAPPPDFWRVFALYVSVGSLSSIPWAYYNFPGELESKKNNVGDALRWFGNMKNPIPAWYTNAKK